MIALTLGIRQDDGSWTAVTDRGERIHVPATAVEGWSPVGGQRVVADRDQTGTVVRVQVAGSSLALP